MHEEMQNFLNAYLDRELRGTRLLEVKRHLAACKTCRETLKELRLVSELLKADAPPPFTPPERFAERVTLNLPRRPLHARPPKPGSLAWWLAPVLILGGWFFVRVVFLLSNWVTAADAIGLLGQNFWLEPRSQLFWLEMARNLFPGQIQETIGLVSWLGGWGLSLWQSLSLQVGIIALYWFWLALWWRMRGPRPMLPRTAPSNR
ncbi:MAG: zf-HC2 domain-containing protein [Anaerolineales bacterium]|nr:zf-HC2 domain-containing protein [Anaerolineales bacterium]MCX7608990.1 zf-HC2 domain-containing protein [Anaerolineales bacterium]MDW8227056.1 zf-HC2 domain-containing protein [Anaerolineales bacterium]